MHIVKLASLGVLVALAGSTAANATITYAFDTGNQGWGYGDISGSTATPAGPAPWAGGQLVLIDQASETGVYAPAAVLGNQSAAYNGSISFDVSDAFHDAASYTALILYGSGMNAAVEVSAPTVSTNGAALSTFTFTLNESVFSQFVSGNFVGGALSQAQFQSILGNLTGIAFRTEYNTGPDDSRFDNAVFRGFGPADPAGVPEPATWGMMLLGFGGLGAVLRRRRVGVALAT